MFSNADHWIAGIAAFLPISLVLGNAAFESVVSLTGLIWLIKRVFKVNSNTLRFSSPLLLPLLCWMAAVFLSRLFNGITPYLILHDLSFIRYMLFVLALVDVSQRIAVDRYLLIGLISGVIWAAASTLCVYATGFDFIGRPLTRYTGKLKEAARIAAMCTYAMPFLVVWAMADKTLILKKRLSVIALSIIAFVLLWLMHIRTGLLAATIGILGGLFIALNRRQKWFFVSVGLIFAACGFAVAAYIGYTGTLNSFYDRIYYWKVCWALFQANPVFGVGISTFQEAYHQLAISGTIPPYVAPDGTVFQLNFVSHPHNLVLQLLSCTGVVGFVAFVYSVSIAVRSWFQTSSKWRIGLGTWPFVLVGVGITGWNIYDPFYTSLVIYYMAWMGCRVSESDTIMLPKTI